MWHRTDWQYGDQSVMKSCVRGNKSTFSSVFRFSSQEIPSNCTPRTALSFGCDRSVMQDTWPENQPTSCWCLGFRWRDFPNNSHLSLQVNLLKTMCGVLPIIRIKFGYLNSCVTGRLYLMPMYNFPEYPSTITRTFAINSVIVFAISHIITFWRRNYFFNFSTPCI